MGSGKCKDEQARAATSAAPNSLARRRFIGHQLVLGASLVGGSVAPVFSQSHRLPDSAESALHRLEKFFSVSQKLFYPLPIDTPLDRRVAARLLVALNDQYPSFAQQLDLIPDEPGEAERHSPVAKLIIAAWFLGTVGQTLVTYERALMYRLTSDALPVPSYCTGKPGDWARAPQLKFKRV
ncbi:MULTISPECIES: sorbitol dehydrogenase family protein [Microbulbifer]|uniref:sorbitol dehydrogenase family protein n=1 Tax=Microbulbifer TaxID=48073 RepID=UPI001CD22F86|nr:sorbitol dehydrogenase family protein [Microbulbifer agarilyticus]MCA0900120.1 sorbitol dehydrogenase family protein [Microbulbifer agarilyticus]